MKNPFPRGSLAVEFFFLVSGYLMARHCFKLQNAKCERLGEETVLFLLAKIRSFFLLMCLAEMMSLMLTLITGEMDGKIAVFMNVIGAINECMLLNMTGLKYCALNATWYLSVMILSMAMLYPLCRRYYDIFTHIIAPVFGRMMIGILFLAFGTQTGPAEIVLGSINRGLLRGLAEISMGAASFEIARWFSKIQLTSVGSVFIGAFELLLYIGAILMMTLATIQFDAFIFYVLFVAVTLSFCKKGKYDSMFDNAFCYRLGKFSLPLYLGHIYFADLLDTLSCFDSQTKFILYIVLAACWSFLLQLMEKPCASAIIKVKRMIVS